jgi:hypothetical protein
MKWGIGKELVEHEKPINRKTFRWSGNVLRKPKDQHVKRILNLEPHNLKLLERYAARSGKGLSHALNRLLETEECQNLFPPLRPWRHVVEKPKTTYISQRWLDKLQ